MEMLDHDLPQNTRPPGRFARTKRLLGAAAEGAKDGCIMGSTVPSSYFVQLYRQHSDPWNFAASEYERTKYRRTLDALPRERYRNGCELACSIGVFTRMLARR